MGNGEKRVRGGSLSQFPFPLANFRFPIPLAHFLTHRSTSHSTISLPLFVILSGDNVRSWPPGPIAKESGAKGRGGSARTPRATLRRMTDRLALTGPPRTTQCR